MKKLVVASAIALSLGSFTAAVAEIPMHQLYHHHYGKMHEGAHHGQRQACIGQSAGTAHRSCGTYTGGPVGGLH